MNLILMTSSITIYRIPLVSTTSVSVGFTFSAVLVVTLGLEVFLATAVPLLLEVEVLVHPGFLVVCFDVVVVDFAAGFLVEVFVVEAFAVEVVEVDFSGKVDFAVVVDVEPFTAAVAAVDFAVVVELFAAGVFFGPMVSESNSF